MSVLITLYTLPSAWSVHMPVVEPYLLGCVLAYTLELNFWPIWSSDLSGAAQMW